MHDNYEGFDIALVLWCSEYDEKDNIDEFQRTYIRYHRDGREC